MPRLKIAYQKEMVSKLMSKLSLKNKHDVPKIEKIIDFKSLLDSFPSDRALVFCDESDSSLPSIYEEVKSQVTNYSKWAVIIGPEGGFSEQEKNQLMNEENVLRVTLGKRILRSDTAAISSLFCIQSLIDKRHPVLK